ERDRTRVRLNRLDDHAPRRVAAASPGELRQELERALLRAKVRQPESRVRVDDRGERDAREVVALRDHLRADEDRAVGLGEPRQRSGKGTRLLDRVRVEPDPLELRDLRLELALEPLRAGSEAREL